jgi:hypothetical protein
MSAHSAIFRDMFAIPQPAADEERVEGCPVVQLLDNAEDWTHVLKAIYVIFQNEQLLLTSLF